MDKTIHAPSDDEVVEPIEVSTLANYLNITDVESRKDALSLMIRVNRAMLESYLNRSITPKRYITSYVGYGKAVELMAGVMQILDVQEQLTDGTIKHVPETEYAVLPDDTLVIYDNEDSVSIDVLYIAGFSQSDPEGETMQLALLIMCKQTYEAVPEDPLNAVKAMVAEYRVEVI